MSMLYKPKHNRIMFEEKSYFKTILLYFNSYYKN